MVTKWRLTFTSSYQLFSLIYMMAEKSIHLSPCEVPLSLCLIYIVSIFSFLEKYKELLLKKFILCLPSHPKF